MEYKIVMVGSGFMYVDGKILECDGEAYHQAMIWEGKKEGEK
jgi:hypothetical protein